MSQVRLPSRQNNLALSLSPLQTAHEDFLLSRRAMRCTPSTLNHYRFSSGKFVQWLERQGVTDPKDATAGHVRQWLAEDGSHLKDTALHARARGVKTFLRFLHAEGYVPQLIKFPCRGWRNAGSPVLSPTKCATSWRPATSGRRRS
ncbi:MAG: hypothetical protein ABSF61_04555 [Anaerolineales bacterium]|jgi:site-specific recombinase XerC